MDELNSGPDIHARQIMLNMERWRWLPHTMNQPYIMVNIAGFALDVIDSNRSVLNMKIIVGKKYTRTPLFNATMKYIVLNPWWEIPVSIAKKEVLRDIQTKRGYLAKNNIKVYKDWGSGAKEISPDKVQWDSISPRQLKYRFRQSPGPGNALGRIKFIFPNNYNVYLHDTPNKELFKRNVRTFSHGCLRIEKPIELAKYILKGDTALNDDVLNSDNHEEKMINLLHPLDVYICYWTSWVDDRGDLYFHPDIYGYDKKLARELNLPELPAQETEE